MGDGDDRAGVTLQVLFQPGDRLGVEVVGRLVEQQDIGLLQQEAHQGHAPPLAAGEHRDRRVARRAAQRVHRQFQAAVEVPGVHVIEFVLQLALVFDELVHLVGREVFAEAGVDLVEGAQGIDDFLRPLFDYGADGAGFVQQRLLLQKADGVAGVENGLADKLLVDAGHDA